MFKGIFESIKNNIITPIIEKVKTIFGIKTDREKKLEIELKEKDISLKEKDKEIQRLKEIESKEVERLKRKEKLKQFHETARQQKLTKAEKKKKWYDENVDKWVGDT